MSNLAQTDSDRLRWPGSGSAVPGNTAYGFYDTDPIFLNECSSSAVWAARRLGYPVVDIELLDVNFYTYFEEAVTKYGALVNEFNIKNNMMNFLGQSSTTVVSGKAVVGMPLPAIVRMAQTYGAEVGAGGHVEWRRAHVMTTPNTQSYDLQPIVDAAISSSGGQVSGNVIEVKRIFHFRSPAMARIYDPFSMTGMSYSNVLTEMGFGAYSPATQFLMTPIFEDLLRGQAIEFNDEVRKSAYSFELINNKLKIFPIPTSAYNIYFDYVLEKDKQAEQFASGSAYESISDFSNVPYENPNYAKINAPGRLWIKQYFLAICKEALGAIRQKYSTVPIPDGEVTLDGGELRAEAKEEKDKLVEQLMEMLDASTSLSQLQNAADKAEKLQDSLKHIPLMLYIG